MADSTSGIPRREALRVIGGAVVAAVTLPVVLEACSPDTSPSPETATLEIDAASLRGGEPVELPFTLPKADGQAVPGSAWLVRETDGTLVAFDPRCTHAKCGYAWKAADGRFECHCHNAAFDLIGKVLYGPPPRPLDRFPLTVADGKVELTVPGDFSTPRPEA